MRNNDATAERDAPNALRTPISAVRDITDTIIAFAINKIVNTNNNAPIPAASRSI